MTNKANLLRVFVFLAFLFPLLGASAYTTTGAMVAKEEEAGETAVVDLEKETLEKGEFSVGLRYGVRGNIKRGRNLPVWVSLTNKGKDFNGKVQVYFQENETNKRHQRDLSLATGETKELSFLLPTILIQPTIRIALTDEKGREVFDEKCRIGALSNVTASGLYFGVLTDAPDRLSYLRQNENRVFFLKPEEIPDDASYLETLDVLVVNDFATGALSPERYQAVKDWVGGGGTLVLGTGVAGGKVWQVFQDDFVTGTVGEVRKAVVSFGAKKTYEKEVLSMEVEGARILYEEDGKTLAYQLTRGRGNVLVFSLELGIGNDEASDLGKALRECIEGNLSAAKKKQLDQEQKEEYSEEDRVLQEMLSVNEQKLPKVEWYAVVLLLYIILVGPVLYLLLKRMDKRNFLWLGMASVSLAFSLVVYLMGHGTRMRNPFLGYVEYLNWDSPGNAATEELYAKVTVPYIGTYRLGFEPKTWVRDNLSDHFYYGGDVETNLDWRNYEQSFDYTGEGLSLEFKDMNAFEEKGVFAKRDCEVDGGYIVKTHYQDGYLEGSFTNQLGYELKDAVLYDNHILIDLGDVADGQTVSLTKEGSKRGTFYKADAMSYSFGGNEFLQELFGYEHVEYNLTYNEAGKRYFAYERFLSRVDADARGESFVLGISGNPTGLLKEGQKLSVNGLQVVTLPFTVENASGVSEFVPSIDSFLVESEGGYDDMENSRIVYDKDVVIVYDFGIKRLESLSYLEEYNPEFDPNSMDGLGWSGRVFAYNRESGEYEVIFEALTPGECKGLEAYLDKENRLTLKYLPDGNAGEVSLPYLSAVLGKE